MVKVREDAMVQKAKQEALEQENILLRKKLEDAERIASEQQKIYGGSLADEMRKIRSKSKPQPNAIMVNVTADHKNISLWTKLGKRIGPMHPDNAIQTLNRFADIGIMLFADQPTPEQIEAYKETSEGKAVIKKEEARRVIKDKSRRSGQIEKLAAEIAKMSGTTVEAINHILKAHEVGNKK